MSQLRQLVSTTLVRGSSPMRAVPFKWQVSSSCVQMSLGVDRLQRLRHEIQRMIDQRACRCRTMNK